MPVEHFTAYTCDRDGVATEPLADGSPPEGWTKLTIQEAPAAGAPPPIMPGMGEIKYLCPACNTTFKEFMVPVTPA